MENLYFILQCHVKANVVEISLCVMSNSAAMYDMLRLQCGGDSCMYFV